MVKHADLIGAELHGAKASIESLSAAPRYLGEMRFYLSTLWIATATSPPNWEPAIRVQPAFNWAVDWGFSVPDSRTITAASLLFNNVSAADANANIAGFSIVHTWSIGVDWALGSTIDLSAFIQEFGAGCYSILLSGDDPYGAHDQPLPGQSIMLAAANPSDAVEVFSFTSPIKGYNNLDYNGVNGFYVSKTMAQIVLKFVNAL